MKFIHSILLAFRSEWRGRLLLRCAWGDKLMPLLHSQSKQWTMLKGFFISPLVKEESLIEYVLQRTRRLDLALWKSVFQAQLTFLFTTLLLKLPLHLIKSGIHFIRAIFEMNSFISRYQANAILWVIAMAWLIWQIDISTALISELHGSSCLNVGFDWPHHIKVMTQGGL